MESINKFRESKFGQIFQYSLIKYIALAFGFLKGIVNAKFLGPELLGLLGNLTLILGYCSYTNLGILNSMNREYVLYKDVSKEKAKSVIDTSFTFLFYISIFLLCMSITSVFLYKDTYGIYLAIIFIIAILDQFRGFFVNYFRLIDNYKIINLIEVISNIVVFILTLVLIGNFKIIGVLVSMLVCGIITFMLGISKMSNLKLKLDSKILKDLLTVGIPLLIYNLGFYILSTIDRIIIIKFLNNTDLGYYTFANSMVNATLVFISSLLFLLYPKMIKIFNEEQSSDVLNKVKIYTKVLEISSVIFFVLGIIFIEPFIKILLPQYLESIGVYMFLLLAVIINNIAYFCNCYIVSNKNQKYLVYMQLIVITLNFILNTFFVWIGLGVKGVALGTLCVNFVYSILQCIIFTKLNTKKISINEIVSIYWKITIFILLQIMAILLGVNYYMFIFVNIIILLIVYFKDLLKMKEYIALIKGL